MSSSIKNKYLLFDVISYRLGILPLLLFMLNSCSNPSAYITQTPVVPLFKEKGDAHLEFGLHRSGQSQDGDTGIGIKAAYAVTDHFVLAGSYYGYGSEIDVDTTHRNNGILSFVDDWGVEHNIFGVSGGWYNHGKDDYHSNWRVEVLGGVSYASLQNLSENGFVFDSKSLTYSIRPSVGYVSEILTVFMSLKFNYLDYIDYETGELNQFAPGNDFFSEYDGHLIVEPSFGVQLGGEHVKFGLHYAINSFNKSISINSSSSTPITSNRMLSLVAILRPKFRRKKKN